MPSNKDLKLHFLSNACEEGLLDTNRLRIQAKNAGLILTDSIRKADLILFYACGHVKMNEAESVQIIEKINRLKKNSAQLIVWGCLPKINPQAIQGIYGGPFIGPDDWAFFSDLFNQPKGNINRIFASSLYASINSTKFSSLQQIIALMSDKFYNCLDKKYYIKIVSGCRNGCTYCSDRLAYKWLRSLPMDTILKQFELGLAANYKHFVFVGRDLGSYGYDIGLTLADLLNKIVITYPYQKYKISIDNVSPNYLIDLYPKLDKKLLAEHISEIGSHIQSGSGKVLKQMGKKFKLEDWEKTINDINIKYPHIRIVTSIMLGFPGETEADFEKTLFLLSKPLFDQIRYYTYCERPNLPSLKLQGPVHETIKIRRMKEAKKIGQSSTLRKRVKSLPIRYL